jgi:hypothetical protein
LTSSAENGTREPSAAQGTTVLLPPTGAKHALIKIERAPTGKSLSDGQRFWLCAPRSSGARPRKSESFLSVQSLADV